MDSPARKQARPRVVVQLRPHNSRAPFSLRKTCVTCSGAVSSSSIAIMSTILTPDRYIGCTFVLDVHRERSLSHTCRARVQQQGSRPSFIRLRTPRRTMSASTGQREHTKIRVAQCCQQLEYDWDTPEMLVFVCIASGMSAQNISCKYQTLVMIFAQAPAACPCPSKPARGLK